MAEEEALATGFARLATELEAELFERREEIRCALLALISGTTFFMLGEAGIAKSMLVRRLHLRISGAEFFDFDMDRFTVPDDLFGPRSLSAMKEDRWERATEGTIVTADFAFLDEFFEASSALVKALLRAMNERTYRQGTEIIPMRLTTLFAASNEIPTDPRLAALYDRLLIRRRLSRISEIGNFMNMLELSLDEKPEAVLSWDDVERAQREAKQVVIPGPMLVACANIRIALAEIDIRPSDRRFAEAMKVVRAAAWLDESSAVHPEHLEVLVDIMWAHPDQIPRVAAAVEAVLEPLRSKVEELISEVEEIRRKIRTDLPQVREMELANELYDKVKEAKSDLQVLQAEAGEGGSRRQREQIERCRVAIREVNLAIRQKLYHVDLKATADE